MITKLADYIVHWPGKDTPACYKHAQALRGMAVAMGFTVSSTPVEPDSVVECTNCAKAVAVPQTDKTHS